MRSKPILAGLAAAACLLMLACAEPTQEEGPGQVVQRFYRALNDGDYDGARGLYDAEALQVLEDPQFSSEAAFLAWAEAETKNGTIARVRILNPEVHESGSMIRFELSYEDGTSKTGQAPVSREDGRWKVGLIR